MSDPQQQSNMSPNMQRLVNNGKALTKNSNIKAYVDRVKQLNENSRRKVLTAVKTSYHGNGNKQAVWTEISKAMNGGKRKTRKSKKASKKTRRHRKH